uniref:Uncharacterized protein n=1 Tax=Noctiluca scintillans TaxID=2966 RepID=A0A6T8V2M6_NOCSC
MHALPEKISALRQNLEGSMHRQMADQRLAFDRQLKDHSKDAEDAAVRRAEDFLKPQMFALSERLQTQMNALHLRVAEDALPKIVDVSAQMALHRTETQPLHSRIEASAAQIERLSAHASTTTREIHDLGQDARGAFMDFRAKIAEETSTRDKMCADLRQALNEAMGTAAANNRTAMERAEEQAKHLVEQCQLQETRFLHRMDEQLSLNRREREAGDEDVAQKLRSEMQSLVQLVDDRFAQCSRAADDQLLRAMATLREEQEASVTRVAESFDTHLDGKAWELSGRIEDGLENVLKETEKVHQGAEAALREAVRKLNEFICDTRSVLSAETETLRQRVNGSGQGSDMERTIESLTQRITDLGADCTAQLNSVVQTLSSADHQHSQEHHEKLLEVAERLERCVADMEARCNSFTDAAVADAMSHLNTSLSEAVHSVSQRTDAAQAASQEALRKEAEERNLLGHQLREEFKQEVANVHAQAHALHAAVDRRMDAATDHVNSLDRSLDSVGKQHSEHHETVKHLLRLERQRTEEDGAAHTTLVGQLRDQHEKHVRSEATELRTLIADCRRRLFEETNALREEIRDQPTRKDLHDLVAVAAGQYTELAAAFESHKTQLNSSVDLAVRNESRQQLHHTWNEKGEAKLRMQEVLQLGSELTQLRASASSLTNGVLKALQVIGLMEGGDEHRPVQIEDLLEWERLGKSLTTRIARAWCARGPAGTPTLLALVESVSASTSMPVLDSKWKDEAGARTTADRTIPSFDTWVSPTKRLASIPIMPRLPEESKRFGRGMMI